MKRLPLFVIFFALILSACDGRAAQMPFTVTITSEPGKASPEIANSPVASASETTASSATAALAPLQPCPQP